MVSRISETNINLNGTAQPYGIGMSLRLGVFLIKEKPGQILFHLLFSMPFFNACNTKGNIYVRAQSEVIFTWAPSYGMTDWKYIISLAEFSLILFQAEFIGSSLVYTVSFFYLLTHFTVISSNPCYAPYPLCNHEKIT